MNPMEIKMEVRSGFAAVVDEMVKEMKQAAGQGKVKLRRELRNEWEEEEEKWQKKEIAVVERVLGELMDGKRGVHDMVMEAGVNEEDWTAVQNDVWSWKREVCAGVALILLEEDEDGLFEEVWQPRLLALL